MGRAWRIRVKIPHSIRVKIPHKSVSNLTQIKFIVEPRSLSRGWLPGPNDFGPDRCQANTAPAAQVAYFIGLLPRGGSAPLCLKVLYFQLLIIIIFKKRQYCKNRPAKKRLFLYSPLREYSSKDPRKFSGNQNENIAIFAFISVTT